MSVGREERIELGASVALNVVHHGADGPAVLLVPSATRGATDFEDLGAKLAAAGNEVAEGDAVGVEILTPHRLRFSGPWEIDRERAR